MVPGHLHRLLPLVFLGGMGLLQAVSVAGCTKGDDSDSGGMGECPQPEDLFEAGGEVSPNHRNPVEIADPWMIYTCEDFPENALGLGQTCTSHEDCSGEGQVCAKGVVPCDGDEVGRCTQTCRNDYECADALIDYDTVPELVCVIAQDQLSLCLPSECLASVEGWDTICGPLDGNPVNEEGVGLACTANEDCAGQEASVCPGGDNPERHCTMNCESDEDCGVNAACVCVEDSTCTEYFYVCAPAKSCAEAVRHHHCRGPGVPPRQHGATCEDHEH